MLDWQEILSREGPGVWRTAYRILGHQADAEECFQETFVAALELSRRQPVQCWPALLQRIATSRALDRLRRRRQRGTHEEGADWETIRSPDPSPSQRAEDRELSERLRAALGRLPSQQAEVFCLYCLDEWSYQEIAQSLALSPNAVGVLLHRARQRLQKMVGAILS